MKVGTEAIVKAEAQRNINISIIGCIFPVDYTNFSKIKHLKDSVVQRKLFQTVDVFYCHLVHKRKRFDETDGI